MDTKLAEQALTKFWADTLKLTIDTDIFRGGIPSTISEGVAIIMGAEKGADNYPDIKKYNVQIIGKYDDRDKAVQLLEDISNALPCYGETVTLSAEDKEDVVVTFRGMIKRGSGGTYNQTDDGKKKTYASFNLVAAF